MNYEQKYKKALERARKLATDLPNGRNDRLYHVWDLENIFPELRESEDERISKAIFKALSKKDARDVLIENGIQVSDALAWLEKQGEKKTEKTSIWKHWSGNGIAGNSEGRQTFLINQNGHYSISSCLSFECDYIELSELNKLMQGEQKPVDETKPKFNVGDWITNGYYTWKVTDIKPLDYILQSPNGDVVDDTISYVDEEFHLWTIQDAKEGDVLATDSGRPFIFKGLLDMYHPKSPVAYCGIASDNSFDNNSDENNEWWTNENVYPATKEQCNILFQKMKEEGYVWYAEKKELMKIEQKHDDSLNKEDYGIDGLWHAQRILEKTLGEVDGYQTDDGILEHKCAIAAVKKLSEQKPSWNEEDEKMYNMFRSMAHGTYVVQTQETIDSLLSWLKSLKPNHWKPSEQNIKDLEWCADLVKDKMGIGFHRLQVFIDELKSL